jgi:hypothetical protein
MFLIKLPLKLEEAVFILIEDSLFCFARKKEDGLLVLFLILPSLKLAYVEFYVKRGIAFI